MRRCKLAPVFSATVPKNENQPLQNDDVLLYDEALQRFALSDGATESFNGKLWARILCHNWVYRRRELSASYLDHAIKVYNRCCSPSQLTWAKQGAFERGSFAAFIGLELRHNKIRVVSAGDSLFVVQLISGASFPHPYKDAADFERRPQLLSTRSDLNAPFFQRSERQRHHGYASQYEVARAWERIYVMTDALGQWVLSQESRSEALELLGSFRLPGEFERFVIAMRRRGAMKRDDTTLQVLKVE